MNNKTKNIAFIGLYSALAVVLQYVSSLIPFLQMPKGGNIDLGVIPIFMASYQLGYKSGIITGLLCWLLAWMMGVSGQYYLTIPQYLLDYLIPVSLCGIASLFPKIKNISNIYTGITISMILKYVAHVLSGVYWWFPETSYAGSIASWIYSLSYNLYYNLATLIVALIIVPLLINKLEKGTIKFVGLKK